MQPVFNPKQAILDKISQRGGWVNAHAHLDRSHILSEENFKLTNSSLKEKWNYPDIFKRQASVDDIYQNMARGLDSLINQGTQAVCSFIDVDPVIEDKAIHAAEKIKQDYTGKIELKLVNQVIKGVIDNDAREWFEKGAEFVDFIGGLPEKDEGHEAEHLDILFEAGKRNGYKPLHVHIDQLNIPEQRGTELLIDKTIEHGYEGKVVAIHSISVGSQPKQYRQEIYKRLRETGITVIACPVAWIDNSWVAGKDEDIIGPIHNAVTPVVEMLEAGVTVAIGTDNVQDIYKPFADGNMWTELRFLIEAQHLYDIDALVEIAVDNGRKAMFL